MINFKFKRLKIPDVILIEPKIFRDQRGFFAEIYKHPDFKKAGMTHEWRQVNHSRSEKHVLRGLHYQKKPRAQAKLARVLWGKIFDVAVDLRQGSPFYGQWVGIELTCEAMKMLYIPEGFAHGFCVLSEAAEVEYYSSDIYAPGLERGIRFNDPKIQIKWPVKKPMLSKKDSAFPFFDAADNDFVYAK